MLTALLNYNSKQNVWLRENRVKAVVIGLTPSVLIAAITARAIAKSSRS